MKSDRLKTIKAAILFILRNSKEEKCDIYGVVKTAFFAQQYHLSDWGTPLFDDKICALPFGPVPSDIYDILKMARGDRSAIAFHANDGFSFVSDAICFLDELFYAKEEPDMDWLSTSDIDSLNKAIKKVSKMSFAQIKKATHAGEEYQRAFQTTGLRRMNEIAIAKDGGAEPPALEHLAEYMDTLRVIAQ